MNGQIRVPSLLPAVSESAIVGQSRAVQNLLDLIRRVGPTDATVLIWGETGSGKGLVAKALHRASRRASHPFVPVHCGGFPDQLLEAELFGHVKGAFTGAAAERIGRFESANGGTLFLDEIGEMSPQAQIRLLQALDEKCVERLGSNERHHLNIRVLCATHRDLAAAAVSGVFRLDLYYRLKVVEIAVPPLRERPEDIPLLVDHFLGSCRQCPACRIKGITPEALDRLASWPWPGNVRELQHAIEAACVKCSGNVIGIDDLPVLDRNALGWPLCGERRIRGDRRRSFQSPASAMRLSAETAERAASTEEASALIAALNHKQWNIGATATMLGIHRTTLWRRIKSLGLKA